MSFQDFRIIGNRVAQIDSDGVVGYRFPNEGGEFGQAMILDSNNTLSFKDIAAEGGGGASVTIADNPPENPNEGDLWYDTLYDYKTYVWYEEEQKWIDTQTRIGSFFNTSLRILNSNNQVLKKIYGSGFGSDLVETSIDQVDPIPNVPEELLTIANFDNITLKNLFLKRPPLRPVEGVTENEADPRDLTKWAHYGGFGPEITDWKRAGRTAGAVSDQNLEATFSFRVEPYNSTERTYDRLATQRGHTFDLRITSTNGGAIGNPNSCRRQVQIIVDKPFGTRNVVAQTGIYGAGTYNIDNGKNVGVTQTIYFNPLNPGFDAVSPEFLYISAPDSTRRFNTGVEWSVLATEDSQIQTIRLFNVVIVGTGRVLLKYIESGWDGDWEDRGVSIFTKFTPSSRMAPFGEYEEA